jgi:glycerol-3-phosphate O-acyltransferase 3/4
MCGFLFRYTVMFPLRLCFFLVGMLLLTAVTTLLGMFPESQLKAQLYEKTTTLCYQVLARSISAQVHFHNRKNRTT